MILTPVQTIIIILMVALSAIITRFLPFILFSGNNESHPYIAYLGSVLPYSAIGLLVVYCLKGVSFTAPSLWAPEALAIILIAVLHYWKNNVFLSISAGTIAYMLLVQFVF